MRKESVSSHPARDPDGDESSHEVESQSKLRLWLSLCLLLVLGGLLFVTRESWSRGGAMKYPHQRTIHSNDGRKIDVTMLGRVNESFYIERQADGKRFELSLDKISPDDRELINDLPEGGSHPLLDEKLDESGELSPQLRKFVELRKAELTDAEIDLEETKAKIQELNSGTVSDPASNDALQKSARKQKWVAYELRKEIAESKNAQAQAKEEGK